MVLYFDFINQFCVRISLSKVTWKYENKIVHKNGHFNEPDRYTSSYIINAYYDIFIIKHGKFRSDPHASS